MMDRLDALEANAMSLVKIVDDLQREITVLKQIAAAQAESIRLMGDEIADLREKRDDGRN